MGCMSNKQRKIQSAQIINNQVTLKNTTPNEVVLKIRKPAPNFAAISYYQNGFQLLNLKDFRGKYLVLFFYPYDFSFVCPTEIIAFSDKKNEFKAINCEVIGVSIDSQYSHRKYCEISRENGGLGDLQIHLVSDVGQKMVKDYKVMVDDFENPDYGATYRGTFIIDGKGILRQYSICDFQVGRSVDEILRLVQAFQFTDTHGEVCPASWKPGGKSMVPNHESDQLQKYWREVHANRK